MKRLCVITIAALVIAAVSGLAQGLRIDSFSRNGTLSWDHDTTNGCHTIEWSSLLTGEWHSSWELINIPATGGVSAAEVPMFYRVTWDTNATSATTPMLTYCTYRPGQIRVYQGTWDSDDIRIEVTEQPYIEVIANAPRLVWPVKNYNYVEAENTTRYVYTAYAYADTSSWVWWQEVDADGTTNDMNYAAFKINMAVNEMTSSDARLLDVGNKLFPELNGSALDYAKVQVNVGPGAFWVVYFVRDYGEYVLKYGETDDAQVQKYLLYAEYESESVGTKPDWFDDVFPQ